MTDREVRKLAQRIVRLERGQKALTGTAQLGYSSMEDRPINDYDADGTLRSVIGRQHDGTHTVTVTAGPKPPTPSDPTVTTDFSTVTVRWDGVFCNPEGVPDSTVPAPADWSRVEVHVSQEESAPTPSTARASIVAARGGEVTIRVPSGTQNIRLVSWSQAGRMSDPTPTVTVEVEGIGDMVRERLAAAQELIDAAQGELEAGQAELGEKLAAAEESLAGLPDQISAAREQAIAAAAEDATMKADAAQQAAEAKARTAQQAADDALAAVNAGDALWADPGFEQGSGPIGVNGLVSRSDEHAYQGAWSMRYNTNGNAAGNVFSGYVYADVTPGRVYRLSAAVRSDDGLLFTTWVHPFDADGVRVGTLPSLDIQGKPGQWELGEQYIEVPEGVARLRLAPLVPSVHNSVAGKKLFLDNFTLTDVTGSYALFREALDAAAAAQAAAGEARDIAESAVSAASGGNTNFFNNGAPSGVGSLVGDRWFQTTSANAVVGMWRWDGNNWVRQTLNNEVIGNLDAGKITSGFIDAARLRAGSITADKILVGAQENLVPNGSLEWGSTEGWPGAPIFDAVDKPDGLPASARFPPGTRTTIFDAFGRWPVQPGDSIMFELWIKADKPGSRFYAEVQAQDGTHLGTVGSAEAEYHWRSVEGGAGSQLYPISSWTVPTTWTRVRSVVKVRPGVDSIYLRGMYFNYVSGTEQNASVSIAGLKLYKQVGDTLIEPGGIQTPHLAADVLEVGNLKAGVGELDEAVIARLFAEVVVARMVQAEAFIGENAILTGAVTAPKITASEELTAKVASFLTVQAEHMAADAIDGMVITGATVQTSHEHPKTVMDPAGVHVTNEDGQDLVYLGRQIGVRGADGETLAQISDEGTVSGQELNIMGDPVFLGSPLLGGLPNWETPTTDAPAGLLDLLPRGVIAEGARQLFASTITNQERAYIELQFTREPGRSYKVTVSPISVYAPVRAFTALRVRAAWDGSRPTLSSELMANWVTRSGEGTGGESMSSLGGSFIMQSGSSGVIRLLVSLYNDTGTATVFNNVPGGDMRVFVEDVGMTVERTTVARSDTLDLSSPTPPPPPPPEKKNYTKRYRATAGRAFYTSGGYRTSTTQYVYQGNQPGMGGMRSAILFPSMTGDLSGATITGMTAHVDFSHWYYSAGGDAQIQLHGLTSLPTSMPSMEHGWTEYKIPKPGSRTFSIPSRYWDRFKSGSLRGIGIGDTNPSLAEYGYGHWDRAYIEVKYRK